ncbi:MAG: hypothetical protein KAV83_07395, partial [Desulfobacterales bacterium]|nr:hypothetical protein [Desulfobacterales bacterium]
MSIHLEDSIDLRANWVTSSHLIRVDFLELLLSVTHSFLMRKPTSRYNLICHQCFELVKELVRYIHLNPLRAKLVESVGQLDRYRWCGHSVLLGRVKNEWQD